MNYCIDFSTCLYYDLTKCQIGLLKLRSTGEQGYFHLYTIYVAKHKLNKYQIATDFCYPNAKILTNI